MKNFVQLLLIFIPLVISTTGAEEVVVVYGQVGGTVTLQKSAVGPTNKIYIYWYFERLDSPTLVLRNSFDNRFYSKEDQWVKRLSMPSFSLTIKDIQEKDFGTFICKEMQTGKPDIITKYKLCKLTANKTPVSSVVAGESVTLTCNTEPSQGHAKLQIHWLNPQGEKRGENQRELTVRVSGRDNGEWICKVTSDTIVSQAKISVNVLDLSPAPLHPVYTSVSSSLSIPCSLLPQVSWDELKAKGIQGGHWLFFPKPASALMSGDSQRLFSLSLEDSLTWKADLDRGLEAMDPSKNNLSLYSKQAKEEDRGEYVCRLEFKNGLELNRTVRVEVLKILAYPGTELIIGQQLNLTCSLGHALTSDLEVKWIPPKQSSLGSTHHSTHLIIPEVGKGDSGKWECGLWQNKKLLTSAVIRLQIKPRLSVWLLVTICGASVIFILILILSIIIIRRHRNRRHPRRRFCQCKHPKPKGFYRN